MTKKRAALMEELRVSVLNVLWNGIDDNDKGNTTNPELNRALELLWEVAHKLQHAGWNDEPSKKEEKTNEEATNRGGSGRIASAARNSRYTR